MHRLSSGGQRPESGQNLRRLRGGPTLPGPLARTDRHSGESWNPGFLVGHSRIPAFAGTVPLGSEALQARECQAAKRQPDIAQTVAECPEHVLRSNHPGTALLEMVLAGAQQSPLAFSYYSMPLRSLFCVNSGKFFLS